MKRIVMILMAVALVALPTMAQQDQWQSTSTMQGSGSTYSSQVTGVGATSAPSEATTTDSYAPGRLGAGMKKAGSLPGKPTNKDGDEGNVPLGDALIPFMLMAMLFAGVVYIRRKKALNS